MPLVGRPRAGTHASIQRLRPLRRTGVGTELGDTEDDRLRLREAIALVRTAGWIGLVRGLGVGLASLTAAIGCFEMDLPRAARVGAGLLLATTLLLFARGVLRRHAASAPFLVMSSACWALFVCMDIPRVLRLGGAFDLASLRAEPLVLAILPGCVLPELFVVYALLRCDGRAVLRGRTPLPPAAPGESPLRLSGRTLAAQGLLVLALLTGALLCLFAPGLLLTLTASAMLTA